MVLITLKGVDKGANMRAKNDGVLNDVWQIKVSIVINIQYGV